VVYLEIEKLFDAFLKEKQFLSPHLLKVMGGVQALLGSARCGSHGCCSRWNSAAPFC
jgi:hypothetical protein